MPPLSIDISDTIIRLVLLTKRRREWHLPIRAEIPVPKGCIVDGDIKKPADVSQLIRTLVDATGTHQRTAYMFLPERHTFVKMISLPVNAPNDMPKAISESVTQHIPYPIDEVYWDWYGPDQKNSLGQRQVLIGAAPRQTVDTYHQVMVNAGLSIEAAEIESVAIVRALLGPEPPMDSRIILDLGRTRSTLIIVDRGCIQFTSTLRYAGRELNRFIADELKLTDDQAERAKTLFGLDQKRGKGILRKLLIPQLEAITDSIREVESFYAEHFVDHQPLSAIQVTGSGAMLRGLDVELQSRLEQEIIVAPSWIFQQLQTSDPDLPKELGFTHTSVFGLGMMGI